MRKFYKTVYRITVLSEDKIPKEMSIGQIAEECDEGSFSGDVDLQSEEELTGAEAALGLIAQGSDPAFFQLTLDGVECAD